MTDAAPSPVDGGSRRRRLRPTLLALVALVALGAGGTGALAATMAHRTDTPVTPAPGPSIYIPYAGQQSGSGSGSAAAAPGIAMNQAAVGAPASAAVANTSIAYPYPGNALCSGSAPAQVSGHVVTATGTSSIGVGAIKPVYVLSAWINRQSSASASQAVADVEHELSATVDALVGAGIPKGSIHTSTVNVNAYSGKNGPGIPVPAATGQPPLGPTVNASASLTAELPGADIVDKAVIAATTAGADNVNVSTQAPSATAPNVDALSAALAQATDQAHQLATATAKATGVSLGAVSSVSVQQPTMCGYGVGGPELVVGVTVAYSIS
jgi:uncharacterized protein YggE